MCLILFAFKVHPTYKLIVAANRDEYYARPTAAAHFWEDEPQILAGRDLEKLGTWMGVTKTGRFAALTNYRDPKENATSKQTRGELVAGFLKSDEKPEEYLQKAALQAKMYPGYNLLVGDGEELYYYSNIQNEIKKLEPGIYGVSNHLLNTNWPKVKSGKEGLSAISDQKNNNLTDELFKLLQNTDQAPDDFLPNTGVSLEWERILSPLFIKSEGYGTRSSTVLLMNGSDMTYTEKVFSANKVSRQQFKIEFS
ncbi:NRDE family protein [Bacillus sp. S/N-304-OC-R1]|uniref:NRDE family protein n=1 Tax=Bacillus sp. S/N-304-OC-R1 TaxID=2758034 RepID=UPI001C8DF363|nr:NRDE family protein [Bacillus sp. S/N-304-OC-R1]MBY0121847.1 NRDE family protein [Bacillus sp. S/N-304-OC-R1]